VYATRKVLYKKLEDVRKSKVIVYVTGDRRGLETHIHPEAIDMLSDLLDAMFRKSNKISLLLYSRGGVTLAGWNIVNLIRMFCDEFEVIIPAIAHSTATLISIGADRIVMTKQATLGPIDPSVNGPYNPKDPVGMPGFNYPVNVEDVTGYFYLAKKELGKDADLSAAFHQLAQQVHPLALGSVARARDQIKMLAGKLLENHMDSAERREKVIAFLCSESGSHDYTINRREAEKSLGLPVEKPNDAVYKILKDIYIDFRDELKLREAFNPFIILGNSPNPVDYTATRAILESLDGGSYRLQSAGTVLSLAQGLQQIPGQPFSAPVPTIFDQRKQEGWIYESP